MFWIFEPNINKYNKPGNLVGSNRIGIEINRLIKPNITNPSHHAPTRDGNLKHRLKDFV